MRHAACTSITSSPIPRLRELGGEPWMREALARAGAEQHDLDAELLQKPEILRSERVEALDRPILDPRGQPSLLYILLRSVWGGEFILREFSRIKRLPPYVFNITNELKMAARRRGDDIIDLSMGNPDGPTPKHIVEKLVEASQRIDTHGYSVSRGIPRLRKAICEWYRRRYAVELDPDAEAIVTIGSKEGLAHLMLACLERGDTVLVPNPSYPIHIYGAIIAGADIRSVRMTPGVDFFAELERAIRELTPKPKMLVIGFPSNPTAQCVDLIFRKIIALARQHDILVVHDLAYADIVFDGYKAPSIMQVPGAREVAVEFFTMSKSYNMAGWRIGFMVGNRELVSALARIKSYHDYGSFTPIQVASIVALEGPAGLRRGNPQDVPEKTRCHGEGPARHRLDGRGAEGLDVHLGQDPRALRRARLDRVHQAPARGRAHRGRARHRLRRLRRRPRAHRADRERAPPAPGGARHPRHVQKGRTAPGRGVIHPKPATLEGHGVRLEPLSREHEPASMRPRRTAGCGSCSSPACPRTGEQRRYIRTRCKGQERGDMLPWAVRDLKSGAIVGSTRYHDIIAAADRVEIG